jgi:putative PIN family toxin of toxin-antitoxin system
MLVVADTNVFTKTLFENNDWCQKILTLESNGTIKFVFNEATATELLCVITELMMLKKANKSFIYWVHAKILKIILRSTIVEQKTFCSICAEDTNDNKFINCSIDSKAPYIITENGFHLTAQLEPFIKKEYGHLVKILSSFQFHGELLKMKLQAKKV